MVEKIAIQIALEGGKEVEKQLADIGNAGQQSFDQINKAGDQASQGMAKTGEAAVKASESTSKLTLANVALVSAIAESTSGIALHGVEIVQAIRHHETLIESLLKLVSGANSATRALALIAPELTVVGAGALAIAGPIATAVTAFEALEKVVTKVAAGTEQLNHSLQTLAATSGVSFEKLQHGEAAFGQIGIKAETFRSTIAKIQETLAGTETKNLTSGMRDIVALVNQIAAGEKGITFADWVTAADKIKGVSIAMKQAADAGKDATQVLLEFLRSADLATAIKIGAAFGLSEADVDRVRRLDGSISDLIQRIQGAGPLISPEAAASFDRMRTSIQNADSAWIRFKQSVTSTDFAAVAASFSATMNDIKAAALNAAASISERMGQAFRGMATQATADVAAIKAALTEIGVTNFFQQMGTDARNAVTGANQFIAAFVGGVMRGMGASEQAIKAVQDQINGVTQATQTAGQAAQQAGGMFTSFGTMAEQGANTAKAGVEQAAGMFTSFGTTASQSGEKADAAMVRAAGGATMLGEAIQGGADKVATFASAMAGIAWDTISSAAVAAWNALTGAIGPAATAVGDFVSKIGTITWDVISSAGVTAWNALTGAIDSAIASVSRYIGLLLKAIGLRSSGGGAPGEGAPSKARGGLLGGRGTGTSDSNLAWVSRGEYVMPAWAVRQPGVLAFLEALRRSGRLPGFAEGGSVGNGKGTQEKIDPTFARIMEQLSNAINPIIDQIRKIAESIVKNAENLKEPLRGILTRVQEGLSSVFDKLMDDANQVKDSLESVAKSLAAVLTNMQGTLEKKAAGGLLGGRGTGTSDSNLAWVSRGEHIMPARAVAQPGVLAFLEALRRSGGNLAAVLDGMGRFALGGMIRGPMPAFAAGGLAGGMSNVTIQFPGLPAISGLRASSDVVEQLHRAAALAQVRSGGRKPSRYS